jgi:hypothetical protein
MLGCGIVQGRSEPVKAVCDRREPPTALLLGDLPGVEQVELDAAGDPGDAGLCGLARREVSGLFGLAGTGPVRAVPDEEAGHEDLQQERRQGEVCLVRGKAATVAGAAARACGKLMRSGGMPVALAPIPAMVQMAW